MTAAAYAVVLGPSIYKEVVLFRDEGTGDGGEEARPAGAAVEFHRGREQRQAAGGAHENARSLFIVQWATASALGAFFTQHVILRRGEDFLPLFVRALERLGRQRHVGARRKKIFPVLLQLLDAYRAARWRCRPSAPHRRDQERRSRQTFE